MPNVIVEGSDTSHGGKVVSCSSNVTINGKKVARVGDVCSCPMQGHSHCVIVGGDASATIDGIPVAYEGHQTSCGAVLMNGAANCSKQ
ncbi:PAAR domain-containing protein [Aquitalea aquatica]|uniref:PAAR domain-containing protein n=1 Tax=Aquitalea aquatica TaxID=3044273 RepID=A0A838YEP4_9NEIS|nr:PAAR domain-containing protein [Aquitalea magnusonii]MBA4709091.1 PAAR domain-containing protein [Aquitalea magnusonii]